MKAYINGILTFFLTLPVVSAFDPRFTTIGEWINTILTPDMLTFRILIAILLFSLYYVVLEKIPPFNLSQSKGNLFSNEGSTITKAPRIITALILAIISAWGIAGTVDIGAYTGAVGASLLFADWIGGLIILLLAGYLLYKSYGGNADEQNPIIQFYRAFLYLLLVIGFFIISTADMFGYNMADEQNPLGMLFFLAAVALIAVFLYKLINATGLAFGRGGRNDNTLNTGWPSSPSGSESNGSTGGTETHETQEETEDDDRDDRGSTQITQVHQEINNIYVNIRNIQVNIQNNIQVNMQRIVDSLIRRR